MEFRKEFFEIFDREDFTYRKGDEKTKNSFKSSHELWTKWCIYVGLNYNKLGKPIIQPWQNGWGLYKSFWTRFKFTPYKKSAACISLHVNKDEFSIALSTEFKNEKSELSKEEYNRLLLSNLDEWSSKYNIDLNEFYIYDQKSRYTLNEYFNTPEKQNWFANNKEINISVGVTFNNEQILELDTESEKLKDILYKLSYLYEKVQKPNLIYDYLKNAEELIPDKHDGSYELVRETTRAIKTVPYEKLDFADLDALFFTSVGTFRRKTNSKKELIDKCNLPDYEKERIKDLMDKLDEDTNQNKYNNRNDGQKCVGMFGCGFMTFNKTGNDENSAKEFIKLCTDIVDMDEEEKILNRAEETLKKKIKGIGIGSVSTFLHCLKPFIFPIINGKEGQGITTYENLGINLEKSDDTSNYIKNVRIIKEYRDRYFSFKNYRLIDIVKIEAGGESEVKVKDDNKNLILYGPPGTGKTFNVVNKALEIINAKKYGEMIESKSSREELVNEFNRLLEIGQISFCTFHQSYSYEDFVEGLRSDEQGNFVPKDGVFRQICNRASLKKEDNLLRYDFDENNINFHKMSLGDTNNGDESIFDYCIENNCVALGYGENIDYSKCKNQEDIRAEFFKVNKNAKSNDFNITAINRFINLIKKGDIIIVSYGNYKARAIAKVTEDYYYDPNSEIGFSHFRKVQWLYKSEIIEVDRILKNKAFSQQTIYKFGKVDLNIDSIKDLISSKEISDDEKKYVLIIDEINRGNISKIFGELITLIEEDKRIGCQNEIKVTLPYSNKKFGVPSNLYIIGTMNTADRSIALLDTALRRRFEFIEYMPKSELLPVDIEGINLQEFLKMINERIEFLFDRDHTIGHAYFIKEKLSFDDIVEIMKKKVIPLLQEYFYGDFEKIELILGGAGKNGDNNYFLNKEEVNPSKLFNKSHMSNEYPSQCKYTIVDNPSKEAFLNLYSNLKKED